MYLRSNPNKDHAEYLYVVKHAPKNLLEFKGNQGVVQTLNSFVEAKNIPNLIITGPHGVGKSLLVKLLVKEYLGGENYLKQGLLEIYGSLSRSKDVVSEKQSVKNKQKNFNCANITDFMKCTTNLPHDILKMVVIYEFHQMSAEAQMALRRIIELNSNRVRFVFVTQDYSQIIHALQSRCTILKLQRLDISEINDILNHICVIEGISLTNELIELINLNADGDIRTAVNLLQLLGRTTPDKFYSILGIPEISVIKSIADACINCNNIEAYRKTKTLLHSGFDIPDIQNLFYKILIDIPEFPNKNNFLRSLCHDTLIIQECTTETQFYNLINHLCSINS